MLINNDTIVKDTDPIIRTVSLPVNLPLSQEDEQLLREMFQYVQDSTDEEKAKAEAMDIVICSYEGGGYSETKENRKKSAMQHKEITAKYMGKKAFGYHHRTGGNLLLPCGFACNRDDR